MCRLLTGTCEGEGGGGEGDCHRECDLVEGGRCGEGELQNSDVFNLCKNGNMILFYMALVVIMMTTLQALEATWFGVGSSGKGELDESQVSTKRSSS